MRVFFIGDFINDTGPSIANKILRKGLEKNSDLHLFSNSTGRVARIIEVIIKAYQADCICFCSYSKINFWGLKVAKIFNKKTFYIMHGYKTLETKINNQIERDTDLKKINQDEQKLFGSVNKIFCVSEKLMEYMKNAEPQHAEKFDYNYNGLEIESLKQKVAVNKVIRKKNQIISVGGGKRIKNNLTVCKAIERLNEKYNLDLKFVIIGEPSVDKEEICKYDFVTFHDFLSHDKVIELMLESNVYIQNSNFETFGLSVIESLIAGCNLIISNNVGAIGILNSIESSEVIYNNMEIEEIEFKLKDSLENPNNKRLRAGIDSSIENVKSAEQLLKKLEIFCR